MIEHVKIAGSTATISKIGFGCERLYAGNEVKRSARLIEAALSAGIQHFDTAPIYGLGQSEDVLGHVLNGMADITLTTKIGIERPNFGAQSATMAAYRRFVRPLLTHMPGVKTRLLKLYAGVTDNSGASNAAVPRRKLHGSYIRRELEESLKRLKRDRVDLYLVHEPDQFDLDDEALETFIALKREDLIGAFGLAYGRSVRKVPDFGAVIQSRYDNQHLSKKDNKTMIFHGVLRYGWNEADLKSKHASRVGNYVANILQANPDIGIIFTADSKHQIAQVTEALNMTSPKFLNCATNSSMGKF